MFRISAHSTVSTQLLPYTYVIFVTQKIQRKNRQSFKSLEWAVDMGAQLDVDVGTSYRSDKQCREFTRYIAEVERLKLVEEYQKAKFISIVVDGSTDSAVREQEIVYLHHRW